MRVVAGRLGGRVFASPHGHRTHPMSEKVRGAIFSALGDIKGLTVLDAFSGSGALAIEAISRGAVSAIAIDTDTNAHRTITENCRTLGITDQVKAIRATVQAWSGRNQDMRFDLILADPPYDRIPYGDLNVLPGHINDGGTLVLSWPGGEKPLNFVGLEELRTKNYGDAQLVFYRKTG